MPKLSDLLAEKAKAELDIGGAKLEIVWYVLWRDRFTDEEWGDLLASQGRDYLKKILPRVLISWGITDDDGHAIPVTADAIEQHKIPTPLLVAIEQRALSSDLAGKVPKSSNSPGT